MYVCEGKRAALMRKGVRRVKKCNEVKKGSVRKGERCGGRGSMSKNGKFVV